MQRLCHGLLKIVIIGGGAFPYTVAKQCQGV